MPLAYDERGRDGRVMRLILDELRGGERPAAAPAAAGRSPAGADLRRHPAAPADARPLEEWASTVGASARTLARRFRQETGMSFAAWRQQARLLESLRRLAAGEPVTKVALDCGYASASAFGAMFRRALGVAPSAYFADVRRFHRRDQRGELRADRACRPGPRRTSRNACASPATFDTSARVTKPSPIGVELREPRVGVGDAIMPWTKAGTGPEAEREHRCGEKPGCQHASLLSFRSGDAPVDAGGRDGVAGIMPARVALGVNAG